MDESDTQLRELLNEKHRAVKVELGQVEQQIGELQKQRDQLSKTMHHLGALLGNEHPVRISTSTDNGATGRDVADMVVILLTEAGPLHYRDIERVLRERDLIHQSGDNPANSLLARYYGDQRLYRPKRGTYAIRTNQRVRSVGSRRRTRRKRQ